VSEASKIVRSLRTSYRECTGREVEVGGADGHEAYTDASMVAALTGSDSCTVFGPGNTDNAHTADEFVPISDVELCCNLLRDMIARW
jgi:succinyl-diaminopimelate desuccinylase